MTKSKLDKELDDPTMWRPANCPVCERCFIDVQTEKKYGVQRCFYGGPYTGYVRVSDHYSDNI